MRNLANKVIQKLVKKKLKISFAESCTGGMLAASVTSINGASKIFNMGFITYSNQAKIDILKVNKNVIKKYGAVSAECCEVMVKNLAKISKAQINVSVTGIAGPNGGTKKKPIGLVYIGAKRSNKLVITKNIFKQKTRNSIQKASVKRALDIVSSLI
jgi:nicotinamide-nucleotide amidase